MLSTSRVCWSIEGSITRQPKRDIDNSLTARDQAAEGKLAKDRAEQGIAHYLKTGNRMQMKSAVAALTILKLTKRCKPKP